MDSTTNHHFRSPNLVVVGGGFAGVWAALAAERLRRRVSTKGTDLTVTLLSDRPTMGMKPRYHEADQSAVEVPLDRVFAPTTVRIEQARVTGIDPTRHTLVTSAGELPYDALVLAAGSRTSPPDVPGREFLFGLDTGEQAAQLDAHVAAVRHRNVPGAHRAVVIGAGFTGVEIAAELVDRLGGGVHHRGSDVEVVLVERAATIAPDFGPDARREIERALDDLGVRCLTGTTVESIEEGFVTLSTGEEIPTRTTVWTGGVRANAFADDLGVTADGSGRLAVDRDLAVAGVPDVWAAGDVAAAYVDDDHLAPMTCQHALPQGKIAGHNAAAMLLGVSPKTYRQHLYSTCLDLGRAGAVVTIGHDRNDVVATGPDADAWKRFINRTLIYPPLDGDLDRLMKAARADPGGPAFASIARRAVASRRARRRLMASGADGPSALAASA